MTKNPVYSAAPQKGLEMGGAGKGKMTEPHCFTPRPRSHPHTPKGMRGVQQNWITRWLQPQGRHTQKKGEASAGMNTRRLSENLETGETCSSFLPPPSTRTLPSILITSANPLLAPLFHLCRRTEKWRTIIWRNWKPSYPPPREEKIKIKTREFISH